MARARFEVDSDLCIGCGLCHERAPENIDVPAGSYHAVVTQQPRSADEEQALTEAAAYCPTGGLQGQEPDELSTGESEASAPSVLAAASFSR
jgi:ferredoxin